WNYCCMIAVAKRRWMMASLVDPFQLRGFLKTRPKVGMNAAPFIDLMIIAVVLILNGSTFVAAPGVGVDLVRTPQPDFNETLADAVLTIDRNELIFFQGLKIPHSQIGPVLEKYLQE